MRRGFCADWGSMIEVGRASNSMIFDIQSHHHRAS
jgi:hypothetical protein